MDVNNNKTRISCIIHLFCTHRLYLQANWRRSWFDFIQISFLNSSINWHHTRVCVCAPRFYFFSTLTGTFTSSHSSVRIPEQIYWSLTLEMLLSKKTELKRHLHLNALRNHQSLFRRTTLGCGQKMRSPADLARQLDRGDFERETTHIHQFELLPTAARKNNKVEKSTKGFKLSQVLCCNVWHIELSSIHL